MRQSIKQRKILELADKCQKAATINQASLCDALCNLAECLQTKNNHGKNSNRDNAFILSTQEKDSELQHDKTKSDIIVSEEEEDGENDVSDEEILKQVVTSLLHLELVRATSSRSSSSSTSIIQKTIQQKIDECLDLCGLRISFMVAVDMIHIHSSVPSKRLESSETQQGVNSNNCILSASRVVKRILLGLPLLDKHNVVGNNDDWCLDNLQSATTFQSFLREVFYDNNDDDIDSRNKTSTTSTQKPFQSKCQMQILHFINSVIILLPTQIANAFHSCKLKLPYWAVRSNFFRQMIQTSAMGALFSSKHRQSCSNHLNENDIIVDIEELYFSSLIDVLLRNGSSDDVCNGIYNYWKLFMSKEDAIGIDNHQLSTKVIQQATKNLSSSRNCANLIRSCIKKIISEIEIYPTYINRKNAKMICKNECLPFLYDTSLGMLVKADIREIFVNLMVLSPSPSACDIGEQKLITRCVVELLVSCYSCSNETTLLSTKDGEKNPIGTCCVILLEHLIEVTNIWNDALFVHETDHFQQHHVTSFILDAMDYMQKDANNALQDTVIQSLVIGVTNRLNVSETSIREDGMMVAEKLAPILGQELSFDELDGKRDGDIKNNITINTNNRVEVENNSKSSVKSRKVTTAKKKMEKNRTVEIDPDEEYISDDESADDHECETASASNGTSLSDIDSEWSEENIIPIDYDDEEDLRPIPKPQYLQECFNLLRGSDDDHDAKHMHEIALSEISSLVRERPPDLSDMAAIIMNELLHFENRYNSPSFKENRWDGLCSLAVCAPATSIQCLQTEIFADVALEVRLDALEVMKHASYELCGQIELDKMRLDRSKSLKSSSSSSDIKLVAKVTDNLKTRRWRYSKPKSTSVVNKFGDLSPLFFYPLVDGFFQSKSNETLWGGENGGRLLSSLLITLATFVDCAGMHPGQAMLASDLFDLAYSFYDAKNPEVRHAVLVSIGICLPQLKPISLAKILSTNQFSHYLHRIKDYDTNSDCRQIASLILGSFAAIANFAIM